MKYQMKFIVFVTIAGTLFFTTCSSGNNENNSENQVTRETHFIGDAYGGGIVAYILQPGDPGYDASVQHGLIAATIDQSTEIIWALSGKDHTAIPGAENTAIGTGLANTNAILILNGTGIDHAAGLARAYNGRRFTDWYLPSKDELNKLYLNKTVIGGFANAANSYYWSSSEEDADFTWLQDFNNGNQVYYMKTFSYHVRAVRSF